MADGVKVGEAYVEVHADASKAIGEVAKDGQRIGEQLGEGITRGADGKLRDSKGKFVASGEEAGKSFGQGASSQINKILAAGAFIGGTKLAIDKAKELQEAVGGTQAVFKENSNQLDTFAKSAAKNLGLSEQAARDLTTQLGAALKGYGFTLDEATAKSQELATLGGDLAATFGGQTTDAVEALSSALRGEFDPLERYGIAINQTLIDQKAVSLGLAESTSNVDQHARAQAALALIYERSADAQGQFGREATTASGASKIAAAEAENSAAALGTNLLPAYTKVNEILGQVAGKFGALPGPLQTVTLALVGLAALAGPIQSMGRNVKEFTLSVHNAEGAGAIVGGLGVAAAGAAISYGIWADKMHEAEVAAKGVAEQGKAENLAAGYEATGQRLQRVLAQLVGTQADIDRSQAGSILINKDYRDELEKLRNELGNEANSLKKIMEQADALSAATGKSKDETIAWLGEQAKAGKTFANNEEAIKAYTEKTKENTTAAQDSEKQAKLTAEAHKELADRVNDAYNAYQGIIGSSLDYSEAQREVQGKVQDLINLQKTGTANANDYELAQQDILRAFDAQAQAAVDAAEQQATLEGRTLTAREKASIYRGELEKLRDTYPAMADKVQGFINKLGEVPAKTQAEIEVSLKDLTGGVLEGLTTGAGLGAGLVSRITSGIIRPRAAGGPVTAGNPYLVGENGPELMVPGKSGTIVPGGGAGVHIDVHGAGLNSAEVATLLEQRLSVTLASIVDAA